MLHSTHRSKKPKKGLGAAALITGGLQLGGTLISSIMQKRLLEKQNQLALDANVKAINVGAAGDAEEYSNYIANHPELVHGTRKEIQALGDDGTDAITKDMGLITAGTHESGNDLERDVDFVEGGEIIQGNRTFSNRIEAFTPAQFSASMGVVLDEISRISNHATGAAKGELDRLSVKITKKVDGILQAQEAIKDQYGFTVDEDGQVDSSFSSSTGNLNMDKPQLALGSGKAIEILRHGSVRGHALTSAQQRFFGFIAG
ncbi:hypothetical protein LCGC14_2324460, partial [marine sediment metagenome]